MPFCSANGIPQLDVLKKKKNPPQTFESNYRNTIITVTVAVLAFTFCMGLLESWDAIKIGFTEGWNGRIKE